MFNFVQRRRWYFALSGVLIAVSIALMLYSLVTTGALFRLSNEFLGGSLYTLRFTENGVDEAAIRNVFASIGDENIRLQRLGDVDENRWSVRASFHDTETSGGIIDALEALAPIDQESISIQQISASVGQEVAGAAVVAVILASAVVTGFIVIAFRQVPNAFRYGICAIAAMLHDVLIVCGFASLAGLLFGWEIDALFITALLTVVGFSVQDTIVMFDRIRENIPKHLGEPYETIVNRSVLETMHRSLATQLNAFFIMAAILLLGGESIRQFIATLFIGLLTGTYSSIFIAVPLLVAWQQRELRQQTSAPGMLGSEGAGS